MRPRLHAVIDVSSAPRPAEWAEVALENGIDGIFLISHARDDAELVAALQAVRAAWPWAFLGVNVIGRDPAESLSTLEQHGVVDDVDALWTDSAGFDPADVERRAIAFARVKDATAWTGTHFGGVAFKYQPEVDASNLAALTTSAAEHVDVVTTSGPGTGAAVDAGKLDTMVVALDGRPLALASGVTAENVTDVRRHVHHILVSTGIKGEDGRFDPHRIAALRSAAD